MRRAARALCGGADPRTSAVYRQGLIEQVVAGARGVAAVLVEAASGKVGNPDLQLQTHTAARRERGFGSRQQLPPDPRPRSERGGTTPPYRPMISDRERGCAGPRQLRKAGNRGWAARLGAMATALPREPAPGRPRTASAVDTPGPHT